MKTRCQLIAPGASRMLVFCVNQSNNFCAGALRFELFAQISATRSTPPQRTTKSGGKALAGPALDTSCLENKNVMDNV
jgi:hypothetical protein